jgi:hypothetical protein
MPGYTKARITKICTATTLNCEVRILTAWVDYHLNLGIDHMFLFFDDPNHPGVTIFEHNPRVTVVRCDVNYWPGGASKRERLTLHERQWYNANKALEWAKQRGADWIVHIDSDELLYYPGDLRSALQSVPDHVEVVRFRVYEAVPEGLHCEHPFASVRYFRVGPIRPTRKTMPRSVADWAIALARIAGYYLRLAIGKIFCPGARGPFLRGHIGGKSAVRIGAPVQGMGVHVPAPPPGYRYIDYFLPGGAVLHFDCSDFDSWLAKWEERARERNVPRNRDPKRRKQLARFIATRDKEGLPGLQRLYLKEYSLRPWERRVLTYLGLLRDIPLARFFDT